MKIAFLAPMKPPCHPVPSGDRAMARLLMAALRVGGHELRQVGRWRSYDKQGDARWQRRWHALGPRLAARQMRHWQAEGWQPDLVFCYHLYHKAVDWIGPDLARLAGVPYVAAEASFAPKQAGGAWGFAHDHVAHILRDGTAGIITLNPVDSPCVAAVAGPGVAWLDLPPFLDLAEFASRSAPPPVSRAALGLPQGTRLLVTLAMMRDRAKLPSYQLLAKALLRMPARADWHLLICGDGPARKAVTQAFAPFGKRITFAGAIAPDAVPATLAQGDLFIWPAIDEAYGMVFAEAQASGLPVIAGVHGGVAQMLAPDASFTAFMGDADGLAKALSQALDLPEDRLAAQSAMARHFITHQRSLDAAVPLLNAFLHDIHTRHRKARA